MLTTYFQELSNKLSPDCMAASGGRYLHFSSIAMPDTLAGIISVVSGTIPIPQNDVIVCQAYRDRVIFTVNLQQSKRLKAQVPIFWVWFGL